MKGWRPAKIGYAGLTAAVDRNRTCGRHQPFTIGSPCWKLESEKTQNSAFAIILVSLEIDHPIQR